jgi:hypothetical protein
LISEEDALASPRSGVGASIRAGVEEQVLGFDVPVQDLSGVQMSQGLEYLQRQALELLPGHDLIPQEREGTCIRESKP